jgi:hypothetical protein
MLRIGRLGILPASVARLLLGGFAAKATLIFEGAARHANPMLHPERPMRAGTVIETDGSALLYPPPEGVTSR